MAKKGMAATQSDADVSGAAHGPALSPTCYRPSRACCVATARMVSPRSTGHHLTRGPRWQGQRCCRRTGFCAMALEAELPWLVAAADFMPFFPSVFCPSHFSSAMPALHTEQPVALL